MRTPRSSALSISVLALAATLTGGLSAGSASAAATPHKAAATPHKAAATAHTDLNELVQTARRHGQKHETVRTAHATATTSEPPPGCFTTYPDNPADPPSSVRIAERFSGANRYDMATCVSNLTWADRDDPDADPSYVADAVVLARGDLYPDALAGGPFAAQVEGPLLLTSPTSLLPGVAAEIQRVLGAGKTVYLLGGTASLSTGVANAISALGYKTVRISGHDRFEVAVNIAKAMPPTANFFITNGMNFPDALSAGTAAAVYTVGAKYDTSDDTRPFALLFTNNTKMPALTAQYAYDSAQRFGGFWTLFTAGGAGDTATLSVFAPESITAHYTGRDRFEVADNIAQDGFFDPDTGAFLSRGVGLANGMNFPDALAGSVMLGELGNPLLLTVPTSLHFRTETFLANHAAAAAAPTYIDVVGGPASVSDSAMLAARSAFTPRS